MVLFCQSLHGNKEALTNSILHRNVVLQKRLATAQGGESNIRHTRRFASWLWGENRPNDAFAHYPHGGRLDSRYRRPNNYNDSVLDPRSSTLTFEPSVSAPFVNQSFANSIPAPAVPFSHLLNYDYFKTNRPYVCSLDHFKLMRDCVLFASLPACLPTCLRACVLFTCLTACVPGCYLPACLRAWLPTCHHGSTWLDRLVASITAAEMTRTG
jgi:hypothetical protein